MKYIHLFAAFILLFLLGLSSQAGAFSADFSSEEGSPEERKENMERTMTLVNKIDQYMREKNAYVGFISRRGAGDPKTGVSDTDTLDLTGMAHTGFILKNGFGKDASYITCNLVRKKGAKKTDSGEYDLSVLKVWTLPKFFIGSFEKDAIVFLPEKKLQLKLWNMIRANGTIEIEERKRYIKDDKGQLQLDNGEPRYIIERFIKNGMFTILHNPEYNLLSDYTEPSTQNCNEHLLKTYIGVRDHYKAGKAGYDARSMSGAALNEFRNNTIQAIETHYTPGTMILSRTKSTFAFTQNIRFGERHKQSPSLFGLKLKKEQFDIVSVDSFCKKENQDYLGWSDFKVFREKHISGRGWFVEDVGKNFVKTNRLTGKKNEIIEK